jgi:hypothetical protein
MLLVENSTHSDARLSQEGSHLGYQAGSRAGF